MDKLTRLTPAQRENLAAYLDGELDEDEVQRIEEVLGRSEVARHEVSMLARAWELLDELPRTKASEQFTSRTISMVRAIDPRAIPITEQPWYRTARRFAILTAWIAGLSVSLSLGFFLSRDRFSRDTRQLVEDLPLLENYEMYREMESVEFLDHLIKNNTFPKSSSETAK